MIRESLPPRFIFVARSKANRDTLLVKFRKVVRESFSVSTIFNFESIGEIFLLNTRV